MKNLINDGIVKLNTVKNTDESTFIITGLSRSGTTMIAKVIMNLGINVGDNLNPKGVFEDAKCRAFLESNQIHKFKELVVDKNKKHKVWGWKRPAAFQYCEKYVEIVRKPKFIIPLRDSLAISKRNKISLENYEDDFISMFRKISRANMKLANFIETNEYPMLCLSYEKCIFNKSLFVDEIIKYLNIKPTKEQIENATNCINNGDIDYLNSSYLKRKK